ncbi:Nonsense-mediated mRNA decay protein 5 [Gurleya vavrai]
MLSITNKNYETIGNAIKLFTKIFDTYSTKTILDDYNSFMQIYRSILDTLKNTENTKEFLQYKKSAIKFINKILTKTFRNSFSTEEIRNYVLEKNNFQYVYTILIECIRKELSNKTEFITEKDKILRECSNFLSILCNDGKEYGNIMYNDLKFIVFYFIYSLHIFSEDDEINFEDNCKMYLRERYNYYAMDARGYTAVLFTEIIRKIKKEKQIFNLVFNGFLEIINQFHSNPSKENAIKKFSAIYLLSSVSERITDNVKDFISLYILPDLNSNFLFLRSQASYALQFFNGEEIENNLMQFSLNAVLNNMKNENLVLKADSTLSITFFFQHEEIQENFKKSIPYIIQCLLDLQKDNELEAINDVLESVITNYPFEVQQFAPELATCLCNLILKDIQGFDEDKLLLFSGYIRTINELILAEGIPVHSIYKIYCICYEMMCSVFKEKIGDLYSEVIEIFSNFVFNIKQVDDTMWNLFTMAMSIEKDDKISYSDDFIYLIDNFISYGGEKRQLFIKIILNFIEIMCNPDDGNFYDDEHINGCKIIESLILYTGNMVSEYIPFFIDCCTNYYNAFDKDTFVMIYYLEVIMQCFCLDFEITLKKMKGDIKMLNFWIDLYENRHRFTRVNDKKKVLIFISALVTRNDNLGADYKKIARLFLKTLETLPKAIERKEKMQHDDYEAENEEADEIEEDLDFESPLDEFDLNKCIENAFMHMGTFGTEMINCYSEKEKETLAKIFNKN